MADKASPAPRKRDGRSLNKTGRTHQFATRIRKETHEKLYDIAERDGLLLAEVIELAIEAYERERVDESPKA